MASFKLRHFANAETLRAVRPQFLMALLGRHADYFAERGVNFGAFNGAGPDYEAIAGGLMAPEQPPSTLIDDLYYVDEMATQPGMDALLVAAEAAKVAAFDQHEVFEEHAFFVDVGAVGGHRAGRDAASAHASCRR